MAFQVDNLIQSIGTWIENHNGVSIGKVEDVKIDAERSIPEYLILQCSELFGRGNRYFAIPVNPSVIEVNRQGKIILQVDKELLQNAIGVHADDCPKFDPNFSESIYELYHYVQSGLAKKSS